MVESTAGIGAAGALINRASAPSTMDITRGIQMAESKALKKAQADAAKAAKADSKAAAMAKMSRVNTGKYKNLGVAKEAEKSAYDLMSKKAIALESGDYVSSAQLDIEADYLGNYLASKDNAISALKSPKKYDYAKKAGELINAGKDEEAAKYNKPYAPVFVRGEMGDYIVEAPDAVDLNKVYSNVLKNAFRNEISFASLQDAATNTDNYSIKRKMTPQEVAMTSGVLLKDEGYKRDVLYSPDFQQFYDKKYGGSGDPSSIEIGLYDYTQQRISDINQAKIAVKGKPTQESSVYATPYGIKWGKYDTQVIDMTAQDVLNQTYEKRDPANNYIVTTNKEATDVSLREDMKRMVASNPNATWKKLSLIDTGKLTFKNPLSGETITDGEITAIYSGGGKNWVEYKTKNTLTGFENIGVVPMSSDIFTVLNAKMVGGKKGGGLNETVKAFKSVGINFSPYLGTVVNTSGGAAKGGAAKTPEPAKEEKPKKAKISFTAFKKLPENAALLKAGDINALNAAYKSYIKK
jgi:hypothetical protein